jgi:hypothetical protein
MGALCGQCNTTKELLLTDKDVEMILAKPINTLNFNIFEYVDDLGRQTAFISLATKTICVGP